MDIKIGDANMPTRRLVDLTDGDIFSFPSNGLPITTSHFNMKVAWSDGSKGSDLVTILSLAKFTFHQYPCNTPVVRHDAVLIIEPNR